MSPVMFSGVTGLALPYPQFSITLRRPSQCRQLIQRKCTVLFVSILDDYEVLSVSLRLCCEALIAESSSLRFTLQLSLLGLSILQPSITLYLHWK
jgi:hypothetical protein